MNPYNFSTLFFAFGTLFVGLLVWLKRKDETAKRFFIFSIFVTLWAIGFAILSNSAATYRSALFGSRFANFHAAFIPITWVHFILTFLGKDHVRRKLIHGLYLLGIFIVLFSPTPLFVPYVAENLIPGFRWYTQPGPVYHVFTILFFAVVPYGFWEMVRALHKSKGKERLQIKLFIAATFFGFAGGSTTFLPVYGILLPVYGVFLMPAYPFIMAYGMIEHGLFDLEAIAQSFQREKLATIGLIASSINHEIKSPLFAAKMLLDNYVERTREGLKSGEPLEIAERSRRQIQRVLDVISKLNRFARPAGDHIPGPASRASLSEALENVLDLVSYQFELERIHIKNEIDPGLPLLCADQRQLEEILFNLIVNACHAMKEARSQERQEGILELRSTLQDSRVILTVSDSGTGISPEQLKHLFEPFHTTKGEHGTGLGLYITKQLVERNGGSITVKSHQGEGTRVILGFRAGERG